jgi:putative transposase
LALQRAQRRVSRRKKGSPRRRKAVVLLAKAQQHVRNQRRTFHHQEACKLVRQSDTISHEDLRVRTLVRHHALAKSIADAGWSAFRTSRTFKAAGAGKRVQAANPALTSQACSGCGVLVQKGLSVRWQLCPDGGTSLPRDPTAAKNILRLGHEHSGPGYGPQALTQPVGADVA